MAATRTNYATNFPRSNTFVSLFQLIGTIRRSESGAKLFPNLQRRFRRNTPARYRFFVGTPYWQDAGTAKTSPRLVRLGAVRVNGDFPVRKTP
jgi:hypothetical protein